MEDEDDTTRKNKASLRRLRRTNYLKQRIQKRAKLDINVTIQRTPFANITNNNLQSNLQQSKQGKKTNQTTQITPSTSNYTPKHPFNINIPNMYRDSFGVIGSVINSNIQTPMGNQPVFSLNDNTPPLRPISLFNRIPYDINTNGKTPLPTPNIFYPETLPNYTQPTSSTNFQMPKRTPTLLNQQGVNLMNRFSEVDTDKASSSGVNDQIPNPIGSSDDDTSSVDTEEQAAFMSHHESESNSSEDEDEVMSINNNTQLPNLEAGNVINIRCYNKLIIIFYMQYNFNNYLLLSQVILILVILLLNVVNVVHACGTKNVGGSQEKVLILSLECVVAMEKFKYLSCQHLLRY